MKIPSGLFQIALTFFATLHGFSQSPTNSTPWFTRSLVGMEVGPTGAQFGHAYTNDVGYCSKFDGREVVRRCAEAHSEYVVMWARDGDYAYYDSKILRKAPGLGSRDPLREAVDEAKKYKMPVIAYCVVQQSGTFLREHPQFAMMDPNGRLINRFCFNSGYLEVMKQITSEMLAYGIDGFHIDMIEHGFNPPHGCWCDTCWPLFEKEFGRKMPKDVTWDEDWERMLEFRYRSSERFEKALYAHVKNINPRATVDFNYHGNPPFSWETGQRPVQHANNADFNTGETGVWGFSALGVGLHAEFYRAATPGKPFQVAMQRGVRMYHDQTIRPLADLRWELLTLLSHGAFVTCVDKTGFNGGLDSVAYERMGAAFADALARRAHFGQRPVADVGIYFSSRTRDWIGRERTNDYFTCFIGAHKAMTYEHIPCGVVLDENVSLKKLKEFPVLLLPNVGILSDAELALFRQYVEEGGNLIITGLTGCYDRWGKFQEKWPLESLAGAKFIRKLDSIDNWVRLTNGEPVLSQSIPLDWPFLVKGTGVVYEVTSAVATGDLLKPHRTYRQEQGRDEADWPMSPDERVGPACLLNTVGKGRVLTLASSPDFATASEHHIAEARRLLANAVRFLRPHPRVRISAPATVEAVVTDDPANRTLRVHLLGYNAPPQGTSIKWRPYILPALMEDLPIFRASIELSDPIDSAQTFNKSTELRRDGQKVEVTVNDIHEVVVIKYK